MKKHIAIFIIISILLFNCIFIGCSNLKTSGANEKKKPVIGVVMGKFDDTWRTSVRNEIYKMGENNAEVDIWNADSSQKTEDEKVDGLIKKKVDVLVVNLVDTSKASDIIDKAEKADIPVIFFNTEPSSQDLKKWDKVYYVGAKGEQSGIMQGEMLVNYFRAHPTKDGIIRYVMLKGQEGHPDTLSRTKYSVKAMEDVGFKLQKIAEGTALWERENGEQEMGEFLDEKDGSIDCVISNNDDMAMGAIDALKNKGYFKDGKYMPVVGVDATAAAINSIKEGTLLGTVLNDYKNQAKAVFNLAVVLAGGKTPTEENIKYAITDNKYIWIDYKVITKGNTDDVK